MDQVSRSEPLLFARFTEACPEPKSLVWQRSTRALRSAEARDIQLIELAI